MRDTGNQSDSSAALSFFQEHRFVAIVAIHAILFCPEPPGGFGAGVRIPHDRSLVHPGVPSSGAVAIVIKLLVFTRFKIWRGSWRYVGLSDMVSLVFASQISVVLFILLFYVAENLALQFHGERLFSLMPDSAFLLDWVGTIILVAGARVAVRLYHEEFRTGDVFVQARLLIVGAGDAGESLLRDIKRMSAPYEVVGFLDDDPTNFMRAFTALRCWARLPTSRRSPPGTPWTRCCWRSPRRRSERSAASSSCARAWACASARCRQSAT